MSLGQTAPDFELKDVNGKSWRLSDQRGKIVVLQFVSSTSPPFVQSLDDFRREVLSRYLLNPGVVFVFVFCEEAHPELLSPVAREQFKQGEYVQRLDAAKRYYYRLKFKDHGVYDISGMVPAADNVVVLVDEVNDGAGQVYGYGRGGAIDPTFVIDQAGMVIGKGLFAGEFLSSTSFRAGNMALVIQSKLE
ncbi:MAG TPA: redoxin domain-containing protein [Phycisphaerae bacterium]|nr:redoxin domain-containing protein [Phycisphaerae bacterium]